MRRALVLAGKPIPSDTTAKKGNVALDIVVDKGGRIKATRR